jgi:integrase
VEIGREAGIVVAPAASEDDATKFASAHDLRRSCADRLVFAGVEEREIAAIMRHASADTTRRHYAPGNVQRSAELIRRKLGKAST